MPTPQNAFALGLRVADLGSRYDRGIALARAVDRGHRAAQAAGVAGDAQAELHRRARVVPVEGRADVVSLSPPPDAPGVLYATHSDPVTLRSVVGPAATRQGRTSTWQLLDCAAARELAALVRDGVPHVADVDDGGRLVARVAATADLLGATPAGRQFERDSPVWPVDPSAAQWAPGGRGRRRLR